MTICHRQIPRNRERGSVLVVALIALVALASLGSLTLVTVRSGISGSSNGRAKAVALMAAEAGLAAGIDYARRNFDTTNLWTNIVNPSASLPNKPVGPGGVLGNTAQPGTAENVFDPVTQAWYEVEIVNNIDDGVPELDATIFVHSGFRHGVDNDGRIIIRATGYGPRDAKAQLELEIQTQALGRPCDDSGSSNDGSMPCGSVNGGSSSSRTDLAL
ncbi:hypothetical protein Hoch_0216 [Haliangium ochraceum DSM 14365]|uniref:Type 4 fimbrial biogenesis protein PilX N-terminal domain-containing protein n=2 Tax=Haliangium ochraceum TaxID=80816 RepID=D0LHJ5_HALO1|nr:hypothetical protein Hoch_0216 [Haliangium ochraceum DSM 14365]